MKTFKQQYDDIHGVNSHVEAIVTEIQKRISTKTKLPYKIYIQTDESLQTEDQLDIIDKLMSNYLTQSNIEHGEYSAGKYTVVVTVTGFI